MDTNVEYEPVVPAETHCRRVAALSAELGRRCCLPAEMRRHLEEAALNHHQGLAAERTAIGRLLDDLATLHHPPSTTSRRELSSGAWAILQRRDRIRPTEHSEWDLPASILRLANAFDEAFEWRTFEGQNGTELLDEFGDLRSMELWPEEVDRAFQAISAGNLDAALRKAENLPVSTVAAVRKLGALRVDDLELATLEDIAKGDPALAADVLRASNAACFHSLTRFSRVREAIGFIGVIRAREVLMASAARGLFASSGLKDLWKHSVGAAVRMRELASSAGVDAEEAFTLGLLHDIGRSAFASVGAACQSAAVLRESGAPETWLEILTMGCDHAEAGAVILANWGFSQSLVEAVRFHHCPERSESKLASAMYLVEASAAPNEDLSSASRKAGAERTLGWEAGQASALNERSLKERSAASLGIAV